MNAKNRHVKMNNLKRMLINFLKKRILFFKINHRVFDEINIKNYINF